MPSTGSFAHYAILIVLFIFGNTYMITGR